MGRSPLMSGGGRILAQPSGGLPDESSGRARVAHAIPGARRVKRVGFLALVLGSTSGRLHARESQSGRKVMKKTAKAKGKATARDLRVSKRSGDVKGGRVFRITNVRANATGLGGGSAAGATPVIASVSTS